MTLAIRSQSLAETIEWAEKMSGASLLPAQYRRQPANLLFACEYADALGISRIHALTSIHVIDGKPTASAELMAAKVRAAGHKLRIEGNDTYAKAQLVRADDPDYTFEVEWTLARAQTAGLLAKKGGNWQKYPAAMLRARAISEIVRMAASDVMAGVVYVPEELGAVVDQDGNVVPGYEQAAQAAPVQAQAEQAGPPQRTAQRGGVQGLKAAAAEDEGDPQVDVDALLEQIASADTEDAVKALWTENKAKLGRRKAEAFDFTKSALDAFAQRAAQPPADPAPAEAPVDPQAPVDAETVPLDENGQPVLA